MYELMYKDTIYTLSDIVCCSMVLKPNYRVIKNK